MGRYDDRYSRRYVPVAERRRRAAKKVAKMKKSGRDVSPVEIAGRKITATFWGEAWCQNLEAYSDYSNRLPRGRTYVRNGSVIDLRIEAGRIRSLVSGTSLYTVEIEIGPLPKKKWAKIQGRCAGQIDSLVELLFTLRGVDPTQMVAAAVDQPKHAGKARKGRVLATDELSSVFGVDIDMGRVSSGEASAPIRSAKTTRRAPKTRKPAAASATKKKSPSKPATRKSAAAKKTAVKKATPKKQVSKRAPSPKRASKKVKKS